MGRGARTRRTNAPKRRLPTRSVGVENGGLEQGEQTLQGRGCRQGQWEGTTGQLSVGGESKGLEQGEQTLQGGGCRQSKRGLLDSYQSEGRVGGGGKNKNKCSKEEAADKVSGRGLLDSY